MASKQLLSFFFLLVTTLSYAQHDLGPCGTRDGRVEWLVNYQQNPELYHRSMEDTLYMPITIHIVGQDDGSGYFNIKNLLSSFCTLNKDFAPSNIQFYIKGNIRYIDNSDYYDHDWQGGSEMIGNHRVPRTINCFIVDNPAGNCGYSSYGFGIALSKSCTSANSHTWAHEVGHHLSLDHPFYGWEGEEHDFSTPAPNIIGGYPVERMDGSNCTVAGDGFCDTPPDYLNNRWSCTADSMSTVTQITPDGVEFRSDGTLFMSYSNNGCSGRFSEEQKAAMRANIMSEKFDYLYQDEAIEAVALESFQAISPQDGEFIPTYQEVLFEWADLPNAHYAQLEISPLQTFSLILYKYDVTDLNSLLVTGLLDDKTYYWRLRAYNNWNICDIYTPQSSFEVGSVTSTSNISTLENIKLAPNPMSVGQVLKIQTDMTESTNLQGKLLNVAGVEVQRFEWNSGFGQQQRLVPMTELRPGIYFLQLQSDKGIWSEKLFVF